MVHRARIVMLGMYIVSTYLIYIPPGLKIEDNEPCEQQFDVNKWPRFALPYNHNIYPKIFTCMACASLLRNSHF